VPSLLLLLWQLRIFNKTIGRKFNYWLFVLSQRCIHVSSHFVKAFVSSKILQRKLTNALRTLPAILRVSLFSLVMMICNYSSAQLHVIQADNSISFHTTDLNQYGIKEKSINAYLLNSFDLNQQHGFVLRSTITDLLGETHIRYIHTWNGHKIIGSDVVCHFKNDILQSLNGRLRVPLSSPSILIEKSTALQAAKQVSGASSFKWEFPSEENMLKIWKEDSTATYYPKGALVYVPKNLDFNNEMALCYQFEINSEEPLMRKNIFINAETGSVWATSTCFT